MALLESLRVDTIKHVTFQLYVQDMPTSVLFKFLLNLNEMIYTCVVIITYIDLFTASFCLSIIHTYIVYLMLFFSSKMHQLQLIDIKRSIVRT